MLSPRGLRQRSEFLQAVRSFFLSREYVEVDTPVRLPVLLPEFHIAPFSSAGWFLHTSPELCMKRLLAGGSSRLFQICHCFRQEESGRYHQPEFTMLEWYHAGWSYLELMEECQDLLCNLVSHLSLPGVTRGNYSIARRGREISLERPWHRLTVEDAFKQYVGMTGQEAMQEDLFDELLVTKIEPHLGWDRPCFLYDYPVALGSLARSKKDNPDVAERFELYLAGIELANGFSELVDAGEQRRRFENEIGGAKKQRRSAEMPEKFLDDLKRLKETAGIALGLDRLLMIVMGAVDISDVLPFTMDDL